MDVTVTQEKEPASSRRLLEALTARLPQWFAQADSNRHYAAQSEILESWVACIGRNPAGLLLLKRHNPASGAALARRSSRPSNGNSRTRRRGISSS